MEIKKPHVRVNPADECALHAEHVCIPRGTWMPKIDHRLHLLFLKETRHLERIQQERSARAGIEPLRCSQTGGTIRDLFHLSHVLEHRFAVELDAHVHPTEQTTGLSDAGNIYIFPPPSMTIETASTIIDGLLHSLSKRQLNEKTPQIPKSRKRRMSFRY